MKKITLAFVLLFLSISLGFSQANLFVEAPQYDNTGGINRGPNGSPSHAFLRACYLVPQSELTNIPSNTNITSFGFTLIVGGTGVPVAGNFTVYLQNTSDLTYQKGTVYNTAITGMTNAYASVFTVPLSTITTSVAVTLSTPFNYTGGGLYVAYDWATTGPFNTMPANYFGESTVLPLPVGGGANFFSSTSAPTTMTLTGSRPSFLFGLSNPFTNDMSVLGIEAPGKVAIPLNTPQTIKAFVKNTGSSTLNNVPVFLNVSGANLFTNTQTITSLAAGQGTLITFSAFNPLLQGANTISVSVLPDQYNGNNSLTYAQNVNCNTWAQNPANGTYTNGAGFNAPGAIIATNFLNPVTSLLSGINLNVSADVGSVGKPLYGVLLSAAGVIVATTNTITVTNTMLGTLQSFSFTPSLSLVANTPYYIGVAQPNPLGPIFRPYAFRSSRYTIANLYSSINIAGGAPAPIAQNFGYFGFEAVLDNFNPNLTIASTSTVVCAGSCAMLTAPAGLTNYTWSIGSNASSITACPASATNNTFSVVGTTTLGCPASGSIAVTVNPLPNITLSSITNSVCVGGTFSFTANGANSYSIGGVTTSSAISQSPGTNTIYIVSGTNANNCVNSATIAVSIATLSVTVSSNTTICKGKTINLTASGPAHYSYSWFLGNLTIPFAIAQVNPSVTTSYSLTSTDGFCAQTNIVTVSVSPVPSVTLSSSKPTSCRGESVTISGNSAGTYSWSSGGLNTASITVAPLLTTVYNTTVTNADGCSSTAQITQNVVICTSISTNEESANTISIWPNPNNGSFILNDDHFTQNKIIEIYNNLGEMVTRNEINNNKMPIDLSFAANGIYFVRIIADNQIVQISKIIKQ